MISNKFISTFKFNSIEHWTYTVRQLPCRAAQVVLVVQKLPANSGSVRDMGLIPGSGRSPGRGHGNPLQYSCPENPMDRGAWQATVHRVTKSHTRLKRLSMHTIIKLGTIQINVTAIFTVLSLSKISRLLDTIRM